MALRRQHAGVFLSVKAERKAMDVLIPYAGKLVSVPKEVADFLERDRRKTAALKKQDDRHLSKSDFETVLSCHDTDSHELENTVIRNLCLERLRNAFAGLDDGEKKLIALRFDKELSLEEIGRSFGVSKMAISKRLKKLLAKLRDSVE